MTNRALYHITHADNLANIIREEHLWCDAQRMARNLESTNIGYSHIKAAMRNAARVVLRKYGYPAGVREEVLDKLFDVIVASHTSGGTDEV